MEKNIYAKLQDMRQELKEKELNKTGSGGGDKFGFKYFTLGDIMPTITDLMTEHKVTSRVSFNTETESGPGDAVLELIDIEDPKQRILFRSPMSTAEVGNQPVQGLGAVQTYLRRYLYVTAFEIAEEDVIDKKRTVTTKKAPPVKKDYASRAKESVSDDGITDKQIKMIQAITKKNKGRFPSDEAMKKIRQLSKRQASDYIDKIESEAVDSMDDIELEDNA